MKKTKISKTIFSIVLTLCCIFQGFGDAWGQAVSITAGSTITQNFDGIGTGATATLPNGWKMENLAFIRSVTTAYAAVGFTSTNNALNSGSAMPSTAGNGRYNFGGGTSTDRAIGGLSSSSASQSVNMYLQITNTGTSAISDFTISYNAERYRNGSNTAGFSIRVYYSTTGAANSWTEFTGAIASFALNGDNNGSTSNPIEVIAVNNKVLNQTVSSNSSLYLCWSYSVTTGTTTSNSQALGIDDISITANQLVNPTITTSVASLSSFSQNSSTPSAEQLYTVSGDNLSGNVVTITPPANYEISLQTGSGFSNNALSLSVSAGNIVNEPVTIYVRQNASSIGSFTGNIAHSSSGATTLNISVSGLRSGSVYSKATGDLDNLNTWGSNTDGSGTAPTNFTSNGMIYEIRNRSAATISSNWVVSGTGSKVVVGDGVNFTDFTIPSSASFTGSIDVSNAAELTVENSTLPTLNILATNSTVEYKDIALSIPLNVSYGNLKLTGNGTKAFLGNTTTILGNLTLSNTQLNGLSSSPFSSIDLKGDLTYIGTVTPPADANSITLRTTGAAGGTQTITGAGNSVRWFRITATTANTILLSTTGGSSDLLIGNATSGGIILIAGTVLNLNGNDLTFFPGGTTNFSLSTGTISVGPTTDFILNKTGSGSLGSLNFTSGANSMGSFTLNHTGSTTNTLTINDPLILNGDLNLSSGELILAANDKLTLTGTLTNNGTFTIENGATLVQGASSTLSGNGTYNVKQTITGAGSTTPTGRFWYLGSPVSLASSSVYFGNAANVVKKRDEANNAWTPLSSGSPENLVVGQGYYTQAMGNATINFTGGLLNNGAITIGGLTRTAGQGFEGFNLVSNPYPSYLDWDAVTKTDVGNTMWYRTYNNTNAQMVFDTYVAGTGGIGTNLNGAGVSNLIPPMQSFWVRVNSGSASGSLGLTNSMRAHFTSINGSTAGLKSTSNERDLFLRMNLLQADKKDQIIVYVNDNATNGFDILDGEKMMQAGAPQFYTSAAGKKITINGLNSAKKQQSLPITMELPTTGVHSFVIEDLEISNGLVWLEDKQEEFLQALEPGTVYEFYANSGINAERFVLHFQLIDDATPVNVYNEVNSSANFSGKGANVHAEAAGVVVIKLPATTEGVTDIQIRDAAGKLVYSGSTNTLETSVQLEQANGIYYVTLNSTSGVEVRKVFVQQ
ncbi:MAG: T9SS type A sorting domain-containing protein [Flavobacteriales bacterium]